MKKCLVTLMMIILALSAMTDDENTSESSIDREGWYISGRFIPIIETGKRLNFTLRDGKLVRSGDSHLQSNLRSVLEPIAVGYRFTKNGQTGIRIEGGIKSITHSSGTPRYDRFDFSSVDLETINENITFDGTFKYLGPRVGLYLDQLLEDGEHILYVGTGMGFFKTNLNYEISVLEINASADNTQWRNSLEIEGGVIFELNDVLDIQVGYEWSRLNWGALGNTAPFVTDEGNLLSFDPIDRHFVKFGFLYYLKRKKR